MIVYDRQGNFLRTWGKGDFSIRTHGIYVAPNGSIFATDDGNHTVRQFTPEGRLLMTMGTLNVPSDTGYDGMTFKFVVPFVAGGVTDIVGRIVAERLGALWSVPTVVENVSGSGRTSAMIGWPEVPPTALRF